MKLFPLTLSEPITHLHVPTLTKKTTLTQLLFLGLASGAVYCFYYNHNNIDDKWLCILLCKRSEEQISKIWYDENSTEVYVIVGDVGIKRFVLKDLRPAIPIISGCSFDQFNSSIHPIGQCVGSSILAYPPMKTVLVVRPRPQSREVIITNFPITEEQFNLNDGYPTSRVLGNIGPGTPDDRVYGRVYPCDYDGINILWLSKLKNEHDWTLHLWQLETDRELTSWKLNYSLLYDYPGTFVFFSSQQQEEKLVIGISPHSLSSLVYWNISTTTTTKTTTTTSTTICTLSDPILAFSCDFPQTIVILCKNQIVSYRCTTKNNNEISFEIDASYTLFPPAQIEMQMPKFVQLLTRTMAVYSDDVGVHIVPLKSTST
jgi:hypothetical protein